ncbi:response regulator transcription factor [Advenella sp. WQ 585]|uniref:Response regulator transcription factor n=1 Tax=Advenella mandrilli TaxID=2800330 RepID=A0ABS1EAH5_9BURK|nr:response regulator transcription factor [Advenella mandrilli]MBK1780519.1 response regulator transcription factor [Advenella mandrilli]
MRILVVEDEPTLSSQLKETLTEAGYVVDVAMNGKDAWFMGEVETFDLAVLDLGLPLMDGISVLKKWRDAALDMPVLILTARDNWHEKVMGIDAGADDYMTKPFHMEELLARVRALLRRTGGHTNAILKNGPIEMDTRNARVSVNGVTLSLTSHEFKVLEYFMHHPAEVISRSILTEHIYAQDADRDSNTIEVFIARLRKKLPSGTIETVRGMGYRLA